MSSGKNRNGIILIAAMLLGLLIFFSFFFLIWAHPMRGADVYEGTWRDSLTLDRVKRLAEDHLKALGNKDLAIDGIMESQFNFYIVARAKI